MSDAPSRLLVLFAPGLWPYRSELDGVCWLLTVGAARALSQLDGLAVYASPSARVDSGGPPRLYRSLPPDDVVLAESRQLGADWVVTGRLLADTTDLELWLNALDGRTGHLLTTARRNATRDRFIWFFTATVSRIVKALGIRFPESLEAHRLAPTTSFGALLAYTRASERDRHGDGGLEATLDVVRLASRAAALDHGFEEAVDLMISVAEPLIARLDDPLHVRRLQESIVGDHAFEPARRLRQAAHKRLLTLAKRQGET